MIQLSSVTIRRWSFSCCDRFLQVNAAKYFPLIIIAFVIFDFPPSFELRRRQKTLYICRFPVMIMRIMVVCCEFVSLGNESTFTKYSVSMTLWKRGFEKRCRQSINCRYAPFFLFQWSASIRPKTTSIIWATFYVWSANAFTMGIFFSVVWKKVNFDRDYIIKFTLKVPNHEMNILELE